MAEKEAKTIKVGKKEYEVIGSNKVTARIFEALVARASLITDALDKARWKDNRTEDNKLKPSYKHTILLGRDDNKKDLRASVAVFPNSVVVQTLREI